MERSAVAASAGGSSRSVSTTNERMCLEISHEHEVCTSRFRMCDPTPTVARAQSGESFVIANDRVLESWEITGSLDGAQRGIFSWPTCGTQ